jgi:hypothetical protein
MRSFGTGGVNIPSSVETYEKAALYTQNGKLLATHDAARSGFAANNLPSGIYLVRVTKGNCSAVMRKPVGR